MEPSMSISDAVAAIGRFLERYRQTTEAGHKERCSDEAIRSAVESVRECERRQYEYFEQLYYNEEKRRDAFGTTFSFLLGVLGIAGAIGSFYLRDVIEWIPNTGAAAMLKDWTITTYLVAVVLDVAYFIRASYFLVMGLYNYSYQYLAPPQEIREYHQELSALYQDPLETEKAFQQYLVDQYALAAHRNDQNNITKRKYIHLCMTSTIYVFVTLAATFIPFVAHKILHHEKEPLLIRWDRARLTLEPGTEEYRSSIIFDNSWPIVELFPETISQNAGQTQTAASQAPISTNNTRETTSPAPPPRLIKGTFRRKGD